MPPDLWTELGCPAYLTYLFAGSPNSRLGSAHPAQPAQTLLHSPVRPLSLIPFSGPLWLQASLVPEYGLGSSPAPRHLGTVRRVPSPAPLASLQTPVSLHHICSPEQLAPWSLPP